MADDSDPDMQRRRRIAVGQAARAAIVRSRRGKKDPGESGLSAGSAIITVIVLVVIVFGLLFAVLRFAN